MINIEHEVEPSPSVPMVTLSDFRTFNVPGNEILIENQAGKDI
jgi:hypothetical protein